MKRNFLFFTALLVIHLPGIAREMNDTHKSDSANHRLAVKENAEYVHGALMQSYSLVPENQVSATNDFPRFRVTLGGGYSYRLAAIPEDLAPSTTEYLRGLKSGFHFQGELAHYFSPFFGLGGYYSITHATTEGDVLFTNGNVQSIEPASGWITTHFIGPQFSLRLLNASGRNAFLINISMGYVSYIQETRVAMSPSRVTGNTYGFAVSYAYEIGVSDNVAIGARLAAIISSLSSYREENNLYIRKVQLASDQREGLSRVDLSLYLRFGKM